MRATLDADTWMGFHGGRLRLAEKGRILLVDDDREIVRGVSVRLRAAGYEVLTAGDGEAGLAAAREQLPDAMVLDLRMPVMDGFTLMARLRECPETEAIPIVVLSANAVEKAKRQAMDLGAAFFLEKPYDPAKLVAAVDAVVAEPSVRAQTT